MTEDQLGRFKNDLAVMQKALALHPPFGKGMLAFGLLLTLAAVGAAVVSLLGEDDWLQLAPLAAVMVLGPVGLYVRHRRSPGLSPEVTVQVVQSVGVYGIVWAAACGYALATYLGPTVGQA